MGALFNLLSGAGAALDLPGSTLRDIAGGMNPFDQWMTPFSWDNRLTGRDLLRQYGAAGSEDTWGNFAAGTGIEMLSDLPAAMLTGGLYSALKGGGKQALRSASKPFEQTASRSLRRAGTIDPTPPVSAARQIPDIEGVLDDAMKLPPPREGYGRVWHGTQADNIDRIRTEGVRTGKELGGTAENAPTVFGYSDPHFRFGDAVVAIDVPAADIVRAGKEARILRSVSPDEIAGILRKQQFKTGDVVTGINPKTGESFTAKIKGDGGGGFFVTEDGSFVSTQFHGLRKVT